MRRSIIVIILLLISSMTIQGQSRGYTSIETRITSSDTMTVVNISPIVIFRRPLDTRRYAQLIHNLKKVYPIAKEANRTLQSMEAHMLTLKTKNQQDAYVKNMEKMLNKKYTPIIKKLTFSQGKMLIKLIDRETDRTSYALVKELRGGFRAFFWQGIARIFGANLKAEYDKDGDDKIIEQLIILYEAGML